MDDLNAFEQQIASVVQQTTRPPRPVDVASIVSEVATQSPRWRFQSLFSATRFVVAGAIVALFGGFLLAGVLTQPSEEQVPAAVTDSPAPTKFGEVLSGLVTEEISSGVLRVLADAIENDLTYVDQVAIATDGTVWVASGDGFGRVGVDEMQLGPDRDDWDWKIAMGGDGVPVAFESEFAGAIARFEGGDWRPYASDGWDSPGPAYRSASGDLWVAAFFNDAGLAIGRYADDGWTWWDRDEVGLGQGLVVDIAETGDDSIWVGVDNFGGPSEAALSRFDGHEWHAVDPFSSGDRFAAGDLEVASDGTLWAGLTGAQVREGYLGHWDGSTWTVKPRPYGRLWSVPTATDDSDDWPANVPIPDVVPSFDSWDLDHATVARAPDGSVWLATDAGLYVVDPEVVAAAHPSPDASDERSGG